MIARLLAAMFGCCACAMALAQPVVVKAVPLKDVVVFPEASAPATVVSLSDSRISSELNAVIEAIPVKVGDVVEAQGVLARLDCSDYELRASELQARLDNVDARVNFAEQQLNRARSLQKQRTVTQELVESRESDLNSLLAERNASRAALSIVQRNREKCTVRAPFRAVVMERLASPGEYAVPGTPLVRILGIDDLEISADVIAAEAESLENAASIAFRYQERDYRDYPVRLRVITPVIDVQTRTREARLVFTDEAPASGAAGRLVWQTGAALPPDLLVRRQNRLGVLLAINGRARFHPLPQALEGRPALIELPLDTRVITDGRFGLNDGDPIALMQ